MTKDGKVVSSKYDKYKQINRFVELIDEGIEPGVTHLNVVDFGCGKSYLTFVLYDYLTRVRGIRVRMIGLDLKEAVIEKCNRIAERNHYDDLRFEVGDINGYEPSFPVDLVISLHAIPQRTLLYTTRSPGARSGSIRFRAASMNSIIRSIKDLWGRFRNTGF